MSVCRDEEVAPEEEGNLTKGLMYRLNNRCI